jgi:hypothetical protein
MAYGRLPMTGLRVKEFDQLVEDVLPLFEASEEARLDRHHRNYRTARVVAVAGLVNRQIGGRLLSAAA